MTAMGFSDLEEVLFPLLGGLPPDGADAPPAPRRAPPPARDAIRRLISGARAADQAAGRGEISVAIEHLSEVQGECEEAFDALRLAEEEVTYH